MRRPLQRHERDRPSIRCPLCGAVSGNPHDVAEGYCGACHAWTSASCRWEYVEPGEPCVLCGWPASAHPRETGRPEALRSCLALPRDEP